jgi:hypothetical protein
VTSPGLLVLVQLLVVYVAPWLLIGVVLDAVFKLAGRILPAYRHARELRPLEPELRLPRRAVIGLVALPATYMLLVALGAIS